MSGATKTREIIEIESFPLIWAAIFRILACWHNKDSHGTKVPELFVAVFSQRLCCRAACTKLSLESHNPNGYHYKGNVLQSVAGGTGAPSHAPPKVKVLLQGQSQGSCRNPSKQITSFQNLSQKDWVNWISASTGFVVVRLQVKPRKELWFWSLFL